MVNLDKHLSNVHFTKPGTKEQKVLCKLGRDRTLLEGKNNQCPLRGCKVKVKNVKHHLSNVHKDVSKADKVLALRPLRWSQAMKELREYRAAKKRPELVTDLDITYFEAMQAHDPKGQVAPPIEEPKCRNRECKTTERRNDVLISKLRHMLSIAQKVSRDLCYNEA